MPDQALAPLPAQADSDETLLRLWLDGRSPHTRRAYEADARAFLAHTGRSLRSATLGDVQTFGAGLTNLAPASRARKLGAIKSLLSFGQRVGYLAFNVGAPMRVPPVKNVLAERILEEADVVRLLALEREPRNHALLRLLYLGGLRISEACGLVWRDAKRRNPGGQVTIFGKGGKTRVVVLPAGIWKELTALRGDAGEDAPVFRSAKSGGPRGPTGGHLDPSQVHRIVKAAAGRAGLPAEVSAHWLRHAHVSHALDRGAPAHLVQQTVGHADLRTTSRYSHARPNESSSKYLAG